MKNLTTKVRLRTLEELKEFVRLATPKPIQKPQQKTDPVPRRIYRILTNP